MPGALRDGRELTAYVLALEAALDECEARRAALFALAAGEAGEKKVNFFVKFFLTPVPAYGISKAIANELIAMSRKPHPKETRKKNENDDDDEKDLKGNSQRKTRRSSL